MYCRSNVPSHCRIRLVLHIIDLKPLAHAHSTFKLFNSKSGDTPPPFPPNRALTFSLFGLTYLAYVLTISASNMFRCLAHPHRGHFAKNDANGDNDGNHLEDTQCSTAVAAPEY